MQTQCLGTDTDFTGSWVHWSCKYSTEMRLKVGFRAVCYIKGCGLGCTEKHNNMCWQLFPILLEPLSKNVF
jgi:hypothetical protein